MQKDGERNWKKQLAINIVYYVGLVFFIKIPETYKTMKYKWKNATKYTDENLGDKRF